MEFSISSICSSCSCLSIIGVAGYFYMQSSEAENKFPLLALGKSLIKKGGKRDKKGGRDRTDSSIKGDSSSDISNL